MRFDPYTHGFTRDALLSAVKSADNDDALYEVLVQIEQSLFNAGAVGVQQEMIETLNLRQLLGLL